jgi:hypothetical protein
MAKLPNNFHFTQGNLQDYTDCPRRFQLRYIFQLAWPASISEPMRVHEKLMKRGESFHRLAEQYLLGLPPDDLEHIAQLSPDEHLENWWQTFIKTLSPYMKGKRFVEKSLTMPFDDYRLGAKYDLVLFDPGKGITIFDWKTSDRPIHRFTLLNKMQTKVYQVVMVSAGNDLMGGFPVEADQIEMVYWSVAYPESSVRIRYSSEQYQKDHRFIAGLIGEIKSRSDDPFPLTENVEMCRFCVYRSLCERGIGAGDVKNQFLEDDERERALDFSMDQVEEISY